MKGVALFVLVVFFALSAAAQQSEREVTTQQTQITDDLANSKRQAGVVKVPSAYMGVRIRNVDSGVRIMKLIKDGPADKGGLRVGDVIQKINGLKSNTVNSLMSLISSFEPNDKIDIEYTRSGIAQKLNLTLEAPHGMPPE